MKTKPVLWEKILTNYISNKDIVSMQYTEFFQLSKKKTNTQIFKWAKDLHGHFSKENTQLGNKYKRRCSTSLGKCGSKPL